jgi:2-polyprenyl-3-methyl-5-hydroxy-6-metoxy-1,4-benzoquinol methylase
MTVKEHYDNHLGNFYSWMMGDFDSKKEEFKKLLIENGILPQTNKVAVDLGAGHGLQSIPLAELGFKILAVDFNQQLINELKANSNGLAITTKIADIRDLNTFLKDRSALIVCCEDTISHLDNKKEIEKIIEDISNSLINGGKVILSFRDYSVSLTNTNRFIPVKSDETKILTCILEYENEFVNVTDLLHEKTNEGWIQKASSYKKVRIMTHEIVEFLQKKNFQIDFNDIINGLTTIIATKTGQSKESFSGIE